MATDRMYDLAFQYKKTKLWKKLFDSDIFAVRLSDGEIGYCCIMGMAGEVNALSLYVGNEGFQSYLSIADLSIDPDMSDMDYLDVMLQPDLLFSQKCLQCEFVSKDELDKEELKEVRAYTKANGIMLRGANAFPHFTKYEPFYFPWHITTEIDERRLCDALEGCLELSALLNTKSKEEIGLSNGTEGAKTIPFFEREKDHYILTYTNVLPKQQIEYPTPMITNDILIARIKKMKKRGVMGCDTMRLPEPVQNEPETAPYYPMFLLVVDKDRDRILPMMPFLDFETHPQTIPESFANALLETKVCPKTIITNNEQTYALLQDMCDKTGIQLTLTKDRLDWLEYARNDLLFHLYETDGVTDMPTHEMLAGVLDIIMNLDDNTLRQMPNELISALFEMESEGILPPEIAVRIRRVFQNH